VSGPGLLSVAYADTVDSLKEPTLILPHDLIVLNETCEESEFWNCQYKFADKELQIRVRAKHEMSGSWMRGKMGYSYYIFRSFYLFLDQIQEVFRIAKDAFYDKEALLKVRNTDRPLF